MTTKQILKKPKDFFERFWEFLSGIFITILGVLLSILLGKPDIVLNPLNVLIISTLSGLILIVTYIVWSQKNVRATYLKLSESNQKLLIHSQSHFEGFKGFTPIEQDSVLELLESKLPNANRFLVIGDGYRYLTTDPTGLEKIRKMYYEQLEERVKSGKLTYKRIAPYSFERDSPLQLHLQACFSYDTGFEVTLINNYTEVYTYFIIDDDLILQVITHKDQSASSFEKNFICSEPEIVNYYERHFERVWHFRKERHHLVSNTDLKNHINSMEDAIGKKVQENSIVIEDAIIKESQDSILRKVLTHQINNVLEPFASILQTGTGRVRRHSHLHTFGTLLSSLGNEDSYVTLSEYKFWKDLEPKAGGMYMDLNKKALASKVRIDRYFLLKEEELIESTESTNIIANIKVNLRESRNEKNYKFCVLPRHIIFETVSKDVSNFGIICRKRTGEKFLVIPFLVDGVYDLESTEIHYYSPTRVSNDKSIKLLAVCERAIEKAKKAAKTQGESTPSFLKQYM